MKNSDIKKIYEKLKNSKRVLISLHDGPDGDSLGSCTAMKYFLERDFKTKVDLISVSDLNEALILFDFVREVEFGKRIDEVDLEKYDLIIFLDFGTFRYYSEKDNFDLKSNFLINIDHHETNQYYGDLNYVDKSKCSTCSILLSLFKEWGIKFDKDLATRLLLGIYTDSLCLSLSIDAVKEASFLIDQDADYLRIVDVIQYNDPVKLYKYYSLIADKFKIMDLNGMKVGVSAVSLDDLKDKNLNLADVRLGPNYLQHIGGIDFLFTLADMGDYVKGSFRSRKNVDTSLFARELNGGGHKLAAAFRLSGVSLEEAEKEVIDVIKKVGIHKAK